MAKAFRDLSGEEAQALVRRCIRRNDTENETRLRLERAGFDGWSGSYKNDGCYIKVMVIHPVLGSIIATKAIYIGTRR
jgi:hypothetical protein